MRPSGNEKVMQSVNDTASVQIMGRHHLIEGAHGAFQHPGVLLTLPLPLPIVDPPAKGFLQDELNLPSAAVGHQQLNVFPLGKQVALRHELERKDGLSQIPVGDVSDVPQDARRRVQALLLADGFQSLLNHQPGERRHANVLRSTSERFNDSRWRVRGEQKTCTAAAFLHHAPKVRLPSVTEVVRVLDDDDARNGGQRTHRRSDGFLARWGRRRIGGCTDVVIKGIQAGSARQSVFRAGALRPQEGFEFGHRTGGFVQVSGLKHVRGGSP